MNAGVYQHTRADLSFYQTIHVYYLFMVSSSALSFLHPDLSANRKRSTEAGKNRERGAEEVSIVLLASMVAHHSQGYHWDA